MRLDFIVNLIKIPDIGPMQKLTIQKIELPNQKQDDELIQRLYDLGLHPGLEIEVVGSISFGSVTIVQFGSTRIALNKEEFSCLHGR